MAVRLAIIGLETLQRDWIAALAALRQAQRIELVGVGHRTIALARDAADALDVPAFDDLRKLMHDGNPQAILLDRPSQVGVDFLISCIQQNVALFSLGPPVFTVAEAQALADELQPRTPFLYIWPRLAHTRAYRHCAQADDFVRPVKFAAASWYAFNHPLARTSNNPHDAVRSLSTLAWDALGSLIDLVGGGALPETVFASIRGTVGKGDSFNDLTGAAALTLRFPEDATVSLTASDRIGPWQRSILLQGAAGTLRLDEESYVFSDPDGKLIDEGRPLAATGVERAVEELGEFLEHLQAQPSPHRGWEHRLTGIAATLEAMLVSHRTGQAESPERFLAIRR